QHSGRHGTAIFPDVMRWLWKGWPEPVKSGVSKNNTLEALLIPGEGWQLASEGYRFTEGPAVNAKGEIFSPTGRTTRFTRSVSTAKSASLSAIQSEPMDRRSALTGGSTLWRAASRRSSLMTLKNREARLR